MCGIAGFFGKCPESLLNEMNAVQAHRGPDDFGTWFSPDQGVGMAHRRLSIIDLSPHGHQPMWDASGQILIVFNGEIYNYRILKAELEAVGYEFKSNSDTEVLLNLYLHYGSEFMGRLNGIFAFALWDTQSEEMLVARDGLGVKPFYYAETSEGFLFASELKALIQSEQVSREVDPQAIISYLSFLYSPGERTPLRSVKKLKPGYGFILKASKIVKTVCFYKLPYDQPIIQMSEKEVCDQVRTSLSLAVERQMVADVPVGTFLSGGLDSSAITAFAKQHLGVRKLNCFTMSFDDDVSQAEGNVPDLPYAEKVAQYLEVDLHTIHVGTESAFKLERMIHHLDEPQADLAALNVLYISELAREYGIKVLLSGSGGDDLFTGYRRHYALMMERYWGRLPKLLRSWLRVIGNRISSFGHFGRRIGKAFNYADLDPDLRLTSYFLWVDPKILKIVCGPRLKQELLRVDPRRVLLDKLGELSPRVPPLNQMLYLEKSGFLVDHNLNYTDKMSMAVGVETRVPLLDPDLVALAARLPIAMKQKGTTGKWVFKKAMEGMLPNEVIYRPKSGFLSPLRRGLHRELKPLVEDTISTESFRSRGLFDPEGVRKLIAMDESGKIDAAHTILGIICIEIWFRGFIDQVPSSIPLKIGSAHTF